MDHKVIRDSNRVLVVETGTGEVVEEGYCKGVYFVNIDPVSGQEMGREKYTHVLQLEAQQEIGEETTRHWGRLALYTGFQDPSGVAKVASLAT